MTNNTPVYWEVQRADGNWVSLHTYTWSVKSFGGRRWTTGPKRGDDILLPHRRGRLWVPKNREAQNFNINMWVFPLEQDGTRSLTKTVEQQAHENFRTLVQAFDQPNQFSIRKRWHEDDSVKSNFGSQTNVKSAIAQAELIDITGPDTDDGRSFHMNIDLRLADPYFYDAEIGPIGIGTQTIQGEAPTDHVTIEMYNGTNPKITFDDGNWIQYNGVLAASPHLIINCLAGTAKAGSTYHNGKISRNPNFPSWGTLYPGVNNLSYTGGGSATITYDAAYR